MEEPAAKMFLMETSAATSLAAFIASSLFILPSAAIEGEAEREELTGVSVADELAIPWKDEDKAPSNTAERAKEKVFMITGALRVFGEDVELLCRFHLVCP